MKPASLSAGIAIAILALLFCSSQIPPVEAAYKEVTFNKFMLYEQLLIYRNKYGISGYYDSSSSPTDNPVINRSQLLGDLPPFPGVELVDSSRLASQLAVHNIDLPRMAYRIFSELCEGDNDTFAWGVRDGQGPLSRYLPNGWTVKTVPQGYLVPMCMCKGQPAVHRVLTRLANFEPFIPLLDNGFSHLSTVVMESCREDNNIEIYWQTGCSACKLEMTKSCVVVSKNNESANVMCNCYHGFDPVSKCNSIADKCTARVMPHSSETGRDLCRADLGNKCSTNGDSYMCTCFMPFFENKTVSNFPNCLGRRGKAKGSGADSAAAKCESKICGNGVCVGRSGRVECQCNPGYAGPDCSEIVAKVADWSEWSDCFPPCGNIGGQFRQRDCESADSDGRFCEGIRRQHRRCQPGRCFENDSFPIFVRSLYGQLPASLYIRSAGVFIGSFCFVYSIGVLIALGINFQDWKLESVNQAGKLAYAVDQVCDELIIRHAEQEAQRQKERIEKHEQKRAERGEADLENEDEDADAEADLEDEVFGESEDFFRMGVFVPHPVVDHLTGVSRLQLRKLRREKVLKAESLGQQKVNKKRLSQRTQVDKIDYDKLFVQPSKKIIDGDDEELIEEPPDAGGYVEGEGEGENDGEGEDEGEYDAAEAWAED